MTKKTFLFGSWDNIFMILHGQEVEQIVAYLKEDYTYNLLSFFGCTRPQKNTVLCIEATIDNKVHNVNYTVEKDEAQEILENILLQIPKLKKSKAEENDEEENIDEEQQDDEEDDDEEQQNNEEQQDKEENNEEEADEAKQDGKECSDDCYCHQVDLNELKSVEPKPSTEPKPELENTEPNLSSVETTLEN